MVSLTFYSYSKLLSYNATYNFVVGPRGNGKTYGSKRKSISDFFARGDEFIYVRRYKEELSLAKDTFFADIMHEFPEHDFRTNGRLAQTASVSTRDDKKRVWRTMGYFVSLSTVQSYKSVSFARVKTIIYDEFILEKSATHYLPNEATIFNNFYSTVDRNQDRTRVFFLANAVKVENPYFIEYGIETRNADANGFLRLFDGFLIVHFIYDEAFQEGVHSTKFGKFIAKASPEYSDFAVKNKFSDNHDNLIGLKTSRARYQFTLETTTGIVSVWFDMGTGLYYIQGSRPKAEKLVTLDPTKMSEDKRLMTFNDKPLQFLRTAFRKGMVWFDKPPSRNTFLEIFKR